MHLLPQTRKHALLAGGSTQGAQWRAARYAVLKGHQGSDAAPPAEAA